MQKVKLSTKKLRSRKNDKENNRKSEVGEVDLHQPSAVLRLYW